jgi:catechol 2,3-dioxygenase-like lactoylglutathione lyase family enzyme
MTTITGIHTVGIPVADQDRALAFYVGTLGFESRLDADIGDGMRWIEVAPPGSTVTLALTAATEDAPIGADTGIRLIAGDVDATHGTMTANGVDVDDVLRWPDVPPMFTFRDLDGNTLYVVASFEG